MLEVANQITCDKALCNMHRSVYCALLGSLSLRSMAVLVGRAK